MVRLLVSWECAKQLPYAGGGKERPRLLASWECAKQLPYAGGGKGPPGPLHPRPMGVCPLEPQIDVVDEGMAGADGSRQI